MCCGGDIATAFPGPYALAALDIKSMSSLPIPFPIRRFAALAVRRRVSCLSDWPTGHARQLRIDRAEVRRLSFVKPEQFPYTTGTKTRDGSPISYDSGNYHACLDAALNRLGADFPERQRRAREQGRYVGLGMASYVEDTGLAPFEGATVRVEPTGRIVIQTGAASQGQGHATIFAQICADQLGVDINNISVESGDTASFPLGIGTIASRVAVTGGSSVHMAAAAVRAKALRPRPTCWRFPGDLGLRMATLKSRL